MGKQTAMGEAVPFSLYIPYFHGTPSHRLLPSRPDPVNTGGHHIFDKPRRPREWVGEVLNRMMNNFEIQMFRLSRIGSMTLDFQYNINLNIY